MLLKEISSSILEEISAFNVSDDSRINREYIWYLMDVYRAVLVRERIRERGSLDGFYQLSCCVPVKCDEIKCNGYAAGQSFYYIDSGELVSGIGDLSVKFAGPVDFASKGAIMRGFDKLSWEAWISSDSSDWTSRRTSFTLVSGYKDGDTMEGDILLLKNIPTDGISVVCLQAIFARPVMSICNDKLDEFHYPIPTDLIAKLKYLCYKDILQAEQATIGDPINDMADIKSALLDQGAGNNMQRGGSNE